MSWRVGQLRLRRHRKQASENEKHEKGSLSQCTCFLEKRERDRTFSSVQRNPRNGWL
jgi:hypothetical protein